jgi:hypothetical protein
MAGGTSVFSAVPSACSIQVDQVKSTSTTATNILALY